MLFLFGVKYITHTPDNRLDLFIAYFWLAPGVCSYPVSSVEYVCMNKFRWHKLSQKSSRLCVCILQIILNTIRLCLINSNKLKNFELH